MRYLGWLVGALLTVAAATSALAADMTPRQVADAYLAAWNAHNADAAAALMADDVTYLDITVGEPQKGRAAARDKVIQLFMTAAPDLTWKMTSEPIESANGIAFEWAFAGTNTGAWGPDTPATGKLFSFNGVTFMRVEKGKIVYQGDYYDGLGFQKQLGWIQ
ncbi:MAG: ester cyclase [Methyloceanibacter sp.]